MKSDHRSILLETERLAILSNASGPKRFEAKWLKEEGFRDVVANAWTQAAVDLPDGGVLERLAHMHASLHAWDSDILRQPKRRLKSAQRKLKRAMAGPLTAENEVIAKEQAALIELLLEHDEVHWMQRSRANWLQYGDRNTNFFHQYASARRKKNLIKKLKNNNEWVEGTAAQKPIILDYFSNLFTSEVHHVDPEFFDKIQPKVTPLMNDGLLAPFTAEEVKKAAFAIGDLKAPGPDGLHAIFYKRFWSICGESITSEILQALNTGVIPAGWNDTMIVLIPKVDNPESVTQYRPVLDPYCANSGQMVLRISLHGTIIRMADIWFDLGIIFNGDTNLGLEQISYPYLDPRS
ncbi:uncharacterized protein [Lolium perenne]|uniref:uncharacterized protein n=1 Tax=Lolium perenne TaxID=4522 RepID=UPI003A994DE0